MHVFLSLPLCLFRKLFHMTLFACMDGICHLREACQACAQGLLLCAESGHARQRARAFVQRILEFEFDTLVPAHFLAPVPEGKEALAEAFKFLL